MSKPSDEDKQLETPNPNPASKLSEEQLEDISGGADPQVEITP